MTKFILRWAINAVALYLAIWLLPGIDLASKTTSVIWLALIFGLVNALVRPLISILTCPLIILTLGLFTLVINTVMFWLTSMGVPFRTFHAPPTTSSVSIAVQPARSCIAGGRLVARIFAVFGDSSFEREVTSFGYALFEPLEPGVYAVMVPSVRA